MRKDGFYWVLLKSQEWVVGLWDNEQGVWLLAGYKVSWNDEDFDSIDETRLEHMR